MESRPQNPEFRNNPENFHPCGSWIANGATKACTAQTKQAWAQHRSSLDYLYWRMTLLFEATCICM